MIESLDQANQFIRSNCNLTYASTGLYKESFRLNSDLPFQSFEEKKLYQLFLDVFSFGSGPLNEMNSKYKSGWEFKVFFEDEKVIKVPNKIFYEVNTLLYIQNIKKNYDKLNSYIPEKNIAKTSFDFYQPRIYQERGVEVLKVYISEKQYLHEIYDIVKGFEALLITERWLPDVNISISETEGLIELSNVIQISHSLKISDFSYIYDPFRIHPEFTNIVVADRYTHLSKVKKYLEHFLF
ncbi:hypothetical protein EBS02_03360 [bacterium]|nr:hypothetical protein [bacterium]